MLMGNATSPNWGSTRTDSMKTSWWLFDNISSLKNIKINILLAQKRVKKENNESFKS